MSYIYINHAWLIVQLGGPKWVVPLGRRDSTTASLSGANSELPSPFGDLSTIISSFSNKSFTTNEMVALSGTYIYTCTHVHTN